MKPADFLVEHVEGDLYVMRRNGSWFPMRKTVYGTLRYLNTEKDNHDGTKEKALEIMRRGQYDEID